MAAEKIMKIHQFHAVILEIRKVEINQTKRKPLKYFRNLPPRIQDPASYHIYHLNLLSYHTNF